MEIVYRIKENTKKLESEIYKLHNLYTSFGFVCNTGVDVWSLHTHVIYYKNDSGWILSHELKLHDSFKYYYRLELFKPDLGSQCINIELYFEIREYIWLNYNIDDEILKIENMVLALFQKNLKQDYRDYQLRNILK